MITDNVKTLLHYGMVKDSINYIEEEVNNNGSLNKTDRNYLKLVSLILSVKQDKYSQASWKYARMFKNYKSIQLPRYLSKIMFPLKYKEIIDKYSKLKGVDPYLIIALIKQESSFKADVTSPSKAYGLMQLLLKTANKMAKKFKRKVYRVNLFNPEINIKYGIEYFKTLLAKYQGNISYALAAYNAGDHRVDTWLPQMGSIDNEEFVEMIPFTETRNYVKLIIRNYHYYKFYYNR
jgi:soluble lytic murein transglycosylase